MGSLIPLKPSWDLVPKKGRCVPTAPCQLDLVLDSTRLRGMTLTERQSVIRSLARLLLGASGVAIGEDGDDNA